MVGVFVNLNLDGACNTGSFLLSRVPCVGERIDVASFHGRFAYDVMRVTHHGFGNYSNEVAATCVIKRTPDDDLAWKPTKDARVRSKYRRRGPLFAQRHVDKCGY
jgi:hypothetical protein